MDEQLRDEIDRVNLRIWEAAHEDPEGSLTEGVEVKERARAVGYRRGEAEALRTQGYALAILDDVESAFGKTSAALQVITPVENEEPGVVATIHDSLANLYFFVGLYARAFEHSRQGIEFARKGGHPRVEAYCLRNLGVVYLHQRELVKARELLLQSRDLFETIKYRIGVGWTDLHLGEIALEEERYEAALDYLNRVLGSVSEREFAMLYAEARNGAARALRELGRLDEAQRLVEDAVSAPRQFSQTLAVTELIRGRIYLERGDQETAMEVFTETAELASRNGENRVEADSREELARLLADRGEYQAAYRQQVLAAQGRRSRSDEENERQLRNTELRYNMEAVRQEAEKRRLTDLQRLNRELEERVRRRTEALEDERDRLERANNELARISGEREDLIRLLSHDLRNSFSGIWQLLDVIRGVEDDQEYLEVARASSEHGLEIIDSVRNMLSVQSGKHELNLEPVELGPAVQEAVDDVTARFMKKEISFRVLVESTVTVLADRPTLVTSVLGNLLSNAAKFSPHAGEVTVSASHRQESVEIVVADRGIGIPEDLLEVIFDPFAPTTRHGTGGEEGTGFGMPLIQKLVERYGGEISIESGTSASDQGTRVTVLLPAVKR